MPVLRMFERAGEKNRAKETQRKNELTRFVAIDELLQPISLLGFCEGFVFGDQKLLIYIKEI